LISTENPNFEITSKRGMTGSNMDGAPIGGLGITADVFESSASVVLWILCPSFRVQTMNV